jgi:adenylate cyclase
LEPEILYELEGEPFRFTVQKDEIAIGRDEDNDLVINRPWISRRHARLHREADGWHISDLGSLNGTQVNDLGHADVTLRDGDRIFLHKLALVFRDSSAPQAPASDELQHPVALTGEHEDPAQMHSIFQAAVDFASLARRPPDVQHLQKLLTLVTRASEALLTSSSLDDIFGNTLDLLFQQLPVERGFVMLWNEEGTELVTRFVKQRGGDAGPGSAIRFSRTIAERVCRDRVAVLTMDAQTDTRFASGASVFELGIRSAMAAPLWRGDKVDGLIYVDTLQARSFDKFDLDMLSAVGNHLAVAIEQQRLQESVMQQQLVRRRLERYHSPAVVELITAGKNPTGDELFADEREVTVLFADVVGFTQRCESLEPREVAGLLNRYFSEMVERIFRYQGTLDKFIGDCIMAVFGAPLPSADHARRAASAALEMREALEALNAPLPEEARVEFRVGLHSGRVVAGDIGSARRTDYTVLGATVNLAARLESSVARSGQIVISDETRRALGDEFESRPLGEHTLRGISQKVECHELLRRQPNPPQP